MIEDLDEAILGEISMQIVVDHHRRCDGTNPETLTAFDVEKTVRCRFVLVNTENPLDHFQHGNGILRVTRSGFTDTDNITGSRMLSEHRVEINKSVDSTLWQIHLHRNRFQGIGIEVVFSG